MWNKLFMCALVAALTSKANCQFGFNVLNQQQNNPQRLQTGFQQSNFAFPQSDFVFPNFYPQQPIVQNPKPQQRPPFGSNHGQPRPESNGNSGFGGRPKPTFAPKFTTVRTSPLTFAPQLQTGTLQVNRLDERISQTKCVQYSELIKKRFQVAALSLDPSTQDVQLAQCDAVTGLIVGGLNVDKASDFPHMAGIGYPDFNGEISFKCGGTLISELFVLTAAHCQIADRTRPSLVRLGDLNLKVRDNNSPEIDVPIVSFISHEFYDKNSRENDVAVIKMSRNVQFTHNIRPACLQVSNNLPKPKAIATGWGYTEVGGTTSDILQKVQLDIIDNVVCSKVYNDEENYHIYSSQLCAGVLKGGKDTCGGDSGGPLVQTIGNECVFSIVGITSYGSQFCGSRNAPGIYTRVSYYLDWIESKVWG